MAKVVEPVFRKVTVLTTQPMYVEGKLDRRQLGFAERAMVSVVGAEAGDYRPWEAVREWARWIAATLTAGPPPESVATGSVVVQT